MSRQSLADISMPLPFAKMHGSGNDFVLIDNRQEVVPEACYGELARQICRRALSLGADGIVAIEEPPVGNGCDFRWRYINADGSEGEMCGNGAMCAARFARSLGICAERCRFLTPSGIVEAEIGADGRVTLAMPDALLVRPPVRLQQEGLEAEFHQVTVGVPHVVAFVPDADAAFDAATFARFGRAVRLAFAPAGTNVNLVSLRADGALRMRTYERGVEAETLACGTGAVATAMVAETLGLADSPTTVLTSSGQPLRVTFRSHEQGASEVRLTGQTALVATGELTLEALR